MNNMRFLCTVSGISLLMLTGPVAHGQILYSQDFDVDDSANWNINAGNGIDLTSSSLLPMDTNFDFDGDGTVDDRSDIFFDYSSVGIPSAPNSSGGSTRGMKLQANLFSDAFGGMSVSPTGQSFTGDYKLSYDLWSNFVGNLDINSDPPDGPADGQTNLSYAGILTAGTSSNSPGFGNVDSVFFANSTDGDSGADYRVYSSDRDVSYQFPVDQPNDADATYHAGTRNHLGQLYQDTFPSVSAPPDQLSLYPSQTGSTQQGVAGMAWHQAEIEKVGDLVTWKMDGTLLISLDISNFTTPTGGNNILFGHADATQASSSDINSPDLLFTLIDNIVVTGASVVGEPGDYDDDGFVGQSDLDLVLLNWGDTSPPAPANWVNEVPNGLIGQESLDGVLLNWGNGTPAGLASVPEPAAMLLCGFGGLLAASIRRT